MFSVKRTVAFGLLAVVASACGADRNRGRGHPGDLPRQDPPPVTPVNSGDLDPSFPVVVKGRWEIPIGTLDQSATFQLHSLGTSSGQQPISGTVTAAVTFTLSNANLSEPASPTGVASYGSLDVTALRDNTLRVCGAQQNQKCTAAVVRIYTIGTAGAGLWSTIEGVGLPITSGASPVGLTAANAAVLKSVVIGNKTTIKLTDFAAAGNYVVPLSVDFTDAGAGTYGTTIVVEYLTQ